MQPVRDRLIIVTLILVCVSALPSAAESGASPVDRAAPWTLMDAPAQGGVASTDVWVRPAAFQAVRLDEEALQTVLASAPPAWQVSLDDSAATITLPTPDGSWARYAFVEARVMAPELAARFPQIRTYLGRGLDDPAASLRFDVTPAGFHAQVLSPSGAVYIDPLWRNDRIHYACYYKRDRGPAPDGRRCLVGQLPVEDEDLLLTGAIAAASMPLSDNTLRTYRLACAATGEYTQFHGGTVAAGLAAVVTAINRVTGIYELEAGIRLELVPNNDLIIYTSAATDPYSNSDGFAMLSQNQSNLTSVIGSANYDIGHVFSTGGGGVAALQAVCRSNRKAQGVTGLPSPIGDSFYVDYVAHEMGHQFGGNHSFNGINSNCCCGNRNGPTAYEPGSGSTIMGYAGICGADNLQSHSDPYFHLISLQEIVSYSQLGTGSNCAAETIAGNTPPTVDGGPDYTIPKATPFVLTAFATDPDGDILTYAWEQWDLGAGVSLSTPDDGTIPLFRSFNPATEPSRTFPRLSSILNNVSSNSEKLPTVARVLDLRVTVRDNRAGGGGVAYDDVRVTVEAGAGPFRVTGPVGGEAWFGGGTVTWDVAGTDVPPVDTPLVDILLSIDGGQTFPLVLASATPNDGNEFVSTAGVTTTTARIKVIGTNNVFFDINDAHFTIESCFIGSPPSAEPDGVAKNRYLAFQPPADPTPTAIQVRLADLPEPFNIHNEATRWVGPAEVFPDGSAATFVAARLQCDPYYADWSSIALLHVYGAEVIPFGVYAVKALACDGGVAAGAGSLLIETAKWGDIVPPFHGQGPAVQPDFLDIAAVVAAFAEMPNSPGKARAQLQPSVPDPSAIVDFKDIADTVNAFAGVAFPYSGPTNCP